jgi:hypothetical protein
MACGGGGGLQLPHACWKYSFKIMNIIANLVLVPDIIIY